MQDRQAGGLHDVTWVGNLGPPPPQHQASSTLFKPLSQADLTEEMHVEREEEKDEEDGDEEVKVDEDGEAGEEGEEGGEGEEEEVGDRPSASPTSIAGNCWSSPTAITGIDGISWPWPSVDNRSSFTKRGKDAFCPAGRNSFRPEGGSGKGGTEEAEEVGTSGDVEEAGGMQKI